MLLRAASYSDGDVLRPFSVGDVMDTQEGFTSLTTAGSGTVLAAAIAGGALKRTGPGAGFTDTFDTANNIINALSGNAASISAAGSNPFNPSFQTVAFGQLYVAPGQPQPGASFRWLYLNGVAFAMTAAVAASSGVILGANVNVAASLVRQYLFQILNGSPAILANANLTNTSAVVTGMTTQQTNQITPGMSVYGTNVQALSVVNSVQSGVGITMSLTASGTSLSALTLTPTITVTGLFSATA